MSEIKRKGGLIIGIAFIAMSVGETKTLTDVILNVIRLIIGGLIVWVNIDKEVEDVKHNKERS